MITQRQALARMEKETRAEMRRLEDAYNGNLAALWKQTLDELRYNIHLAYVQDFGKGTWDIVGAHSKGTLARIYRDTDITLHSFKAKAASQIKASLAYLRQEERLRALWMIDQVTPNSFLPKAPAQPAREAESPRDAAATWEQAFYTWMAVYHGNLNANLRLEALNASDMYDAAEEADATRIGNFDPAYKLKSMFASQAIKEQADARREIFDGNDESVEEEIWVTMEDGVVCPICEEYDGKPLSEINDDIPAHYNCRCYTRFVPKGWADMLRSGDPDEKDLALSMDDAGLVPDAMAVRSPRTGELIGRAIVSFEDWKAQRAQNIIGISR